MCWTSPRIPSGRIQTSAPSPAWSWALLLPSSELLPISPPPSQNQLEIVGAASQNLGFIHFYLVFFCMAGTLRDLTQISWVKFPPGVFWDGIWPLWLLCRTPPLPVCPFQGGSFVYSLQVGINEVPPNFTPFSGCNPNVSAQATAEIPSGDLSCFCFFWP